MALPGCTSATLIAKIQLECISQVLQLALSVFNLPIARCNSSGVTPPQRAPAVVPCLVLDQQTPIPTCQQIGRAEVVGQLGVQMLPTLVFANPSNSNCYASSVSIDWISTFPLLNANSAIFVVTVLSHIATPRRVRNVCTPTGNVHPHPQLPKGYVPAFFRVNPMCEDVCEFTPIISTGFVG